MDQYHANHQAAFKRAIQKYHSVAFYNKFPIFISFAVVCIQIATLGRVIPTLSHAGPAALAAVLSAAWIAADFVNGLIHLYMDNNTAYSSPAGPFIAAFHLHHQTLCYRERHPLMIYFLETGNKFWLLPCMAIIFLYVTVFSPSVYAAFFLTMFGMLSSFAEVSHYWCHNVRQDQWLIRTLQRVRVLLSKKHHAVHHRHDNTHYAFLNGMTDPLINVIARQFFAGYKNHADRHSVDWIGHQTRNR